MIKSNWIEKTYPFGAYVVTPEGKGYVEAYTCEGGFRGTTTTGIVVLLDSNEYLEVSDEFLSESGQETGRAVYLATF